MKLASSASGAMKVLLYEGYHAEKQHVMAVFAY